MSTASWAAGWLGQLACRAAHDGTVTGLGSGVGLGLGEGLSAGLGVGLGDGDASCEADGLWLGASGPFGVQPETVRRERRTTTPFLTGL
jgi:hypothetical protein